MNGKKSHVALFLSLKGVDFDEQKLSITNAVKLKKLKNKPLLEFLSTVVKNSGTESNIFLKNVLNYVPKKYFAEIINIFWDTKTNLAIEFLKNNQISFGELVLKGKALHERCGVFQYLIKEAIENPDNRKNIEDSSIKNQGNLHYSISVCKYVFRYGNASLVSCCNLLDIERALEDNKLEDQKIFTLLLPLITLQQSDILDYIKLNHPILCKKLSDNVSNLFVLDKPKDIQDSYILPFVGFFFPYFSNNKEKEKIIDLFKACNHQLTPQMLDYLLNLNLKDIINNKESFFEKKLI